MKEVLLGAALALTIWGALSRLDTVEAPAAVPQAVADDGGPLQEVVLHFDPRALDAVGPTYRDLLLAFDPSVAVTVVVASVEDMATFRRLADAWGMVAPERLRMVVAGRRISTWSRDRYTLLDAGGRGVLLVPPRPTEGNEARENDWAVPFALAAARPFDISVEVAPAVFDGGDLLVGGDYVLATQLLRGRNLGGPLGDAGRLGSWLRTASGRGPILLGETPGTVPGHHIGMFVTPLGGRTVLVGDPDAGLSLLPPGAALPLPVDRRPGTLESFRRIAQELEARGFTVLRAPLVPLTDGLTYLSYNNALLERRRDGLHAYVPQFGLPTLDAAGRAAYESAGVTVHPIDVRGIYVWNGTVRCLVNVLRRGAA